MARRSFLVRLFKGSNPFIPRSNKKIYLIGFNPLLSNMNQMFTFFYTNILLYIALIPLIGILILLVLRSEQQKLLKIIALNFSFIPFCRFSISLEWF